MCWPYTPMITTQVDAALNARNYSWEWASRHANERWFFIDMIRSPFSYYTQHAA
jgi:hypothetical protein